MITPLYVFSAHIQQHKYYSVFSIPNEIKEGQARFTMITSVGRTYYVLFKWATELIKNLFAFIVFSLLCFAVVAMFYPTGGKYVLVATITNSFLLNYGASCFLQIVFGMYTLLLHNRIAVFLLTRLQEMFHENLVFVFRFTARCFPVPVFQVKALSRIGCQNACVHSVFHKIVFCNS